MASSAAGSYKKQGSHHLVRKMLRRCSLRSSSSSAAGAGGLPEDVPRGHFAVYVGARRARYVVPVACLAAPGFQELLRKAEEEFGFSHGTAGITLPCDEATFHVVLAAATTSSVR